MGINKMIFDAVDDISTSITDGVFDWLTNLFVNRRKTEFDAKFIRVTDLLSSKEHGWCLDGRHCVDLETATKNAFVSGGSGSYKSAGIITPTLFKMMGHCSLIVTDFSGELFQKTSGAYIKNGYKADVLDLDNPSNSIGYNPFQHFINGKADTRKLSKAITAATFKGKGTDPFWELAAEGLISLCAMFLFEYGKPEFLTLGNVYHLVSAIGHSGEKTDKLFLNASNELLAEYKTYIAYGEKVLASIIATCRAALSIFGQDESISLITSHDSIDFETFRKEKRILYICTKTTSMKYYSMVTTIFLQQFFTSIMNKLSEERMLPIYFVIDEASSLNFSGDLLENVCSNIRKYSAGIMQIYQSPSQLVQQFGPHSAKAITENSYCRVFMGGQSITIAQELEATLGRFEYMENDTRHIRSLMTADEIRRSDDCLIFCGNKPPIKTKIVPYFKQPKLLLLSELPPCKPDYKLPFSKPPLLPLD